MTSAGGAMAMVDQPTRTLQDLVRHVDRYPEDAFLFVREGLSYTADRVHGSETDTQRQLQQFLTMQELDWTDLAAAYHAGTLPPPVMEAIDALGGCEKLNRHVSGRDLCWGLRDFALERWGLLARVVLEAWRVRNTLDFGRIVFGFIDFEMMRKQPEDTIEDFKDVFAFGEAFDRPFGISRDETDKAGDEDAGEEDSA
jgi:uncharacterized repeat protein (TIGR04138 family)